MYNYREAVKEDVKNWMNENHQPGESMELKSVSTYKARQNFFEDDNSEDYLYNMYQEGLVTMEEVGRKMACGEWDWIDVSIRCYLLSEVVQEVLEELEF